MSVNAPIDPTTLKAGDVLVEVSTNRLHEVVSFEDGQVWLTHPVAGDMKLGVDMVAQQFMARIAL